MRKLIFCLVPLLVTTSGCALWNKVTGKKSAQTPKTAAPTAAAAPPGPTFAPVPGAPPATNQKLIVTPDSTLAGKVARVETGARFVVLSFPVGHLPVMEQRLNLYRNGLKAGEIKVTGPQLDENVVADIVAGDAQVGDEARDR